MQTPANLIDQVRTLFSARGAASYSGEEVSQLEHALQSARLAEQSGAGDLMVAAALLHDLGHLLHSAEDEIVMGFDDRHEMSGATLLAGWIERRVVETIRLHVAAKRYLCSIEPAYFDALSETSQRTLALQGGVFTTGQAQEFIELPFAADAVALRRWDDSAKVVGLDTPPLVYFLSAVEVALLPDK